MDALEGEYDQTVYTELPVNADRSSVWRGEQPFQSADEPGAK